jgi:hypothetical protein
LPRNRGRWYVCSFRERPGKAKLKKIYAPTAVIRGGQRSFGTFAKNPGAARNKSAGDAGLVAAASSEYLRQLRAIGDDYAAKTKLINSQLASRIEEVTSKEALQSKERIALDYVEANDRFASFAQNRNYYYRQALVNAGVSTNATAAALNAFESGRSTQKPWEANRRLGQSHLATLQFLDTNWGKWAFTNEQIEFETDSLKADCQKLQARVMDAYREVTNWPNKAKP